MLLKKGREYGENQNCNTSAAWYSITYEQTEKRMVACRLTMFHPLYPTHSLEAPV
jgi:hypothetical protein